MPVDSEKLRQTLDQLHQQLEEAESLDPDVAARLRATMDDIRSTLARQAAAASTPASTAGEAPAEVVVPRDETAARDAVVEERVTTSEDAEEPNFTQRIAEAEQQFQTSHPTLSNTLQRLVDILAQMGI